MTLLDEFLAIAESAMPLGLENFWGFRANESGFSLGKSQDKDGSSAQSSIYV